MPIVRYQGSLSSGESYTYDADGNMLTRVEGGITYTQTYDEENRLASITASGNTTRFVYDGDGNLVRKTNPDNSYVLYVKGIYESYRNANGTTSKTRTFYPAGGAMRDSRVTSRGFRPPPRRTSSGCSRAPRARQSRHYAFSGSPRSSRG